MEDDIFLPDWLDADGSAFDDMTQTLTAQSIHPPAVPAWGKLALRTSGSGWAWSTDTRISPWTVYSFMGELPASRLDELLGADQPDMWLFGHRGYGVNSMGAGLIVRMGPMLIAQQVAWGGGYMDPGASTARLNAATAIWNSTLPILAEMAEEPLSIAVLFSDFRGIAELLVLEDRASSASDEADSWATWWSSEDDRLDLQDLEDHDDDAVSLAARHLGQLLDAFDDDSEEPESSEDDECVGNNHDVAEVRLDHRLIDQMPDDDATVIGLDQLVEAILIPHYERGADWEYWRQLVDLTCLVFGLDGRTKYLMQAMEAIPSSVLPMQSALEVPQEIGDGFHRIAGGTKRITEMTEQLRQLQRDFFTAVLVSLDPTISRRSTTIGRLRELGLRRRSYHFDDDDDY